MHNSSTEKLSEHTLPFEDALAFIRQQRRKKIHLHVATWAPFTIQNPTKREQGVSGSGSIEMSKTDVQDFLKTAFPEHWHSKLALRISVYPRCIFVGMPPV